MNPIDNETINGNVIIAEFMGAESYKQDDSTLRFCGKICTRRILENLVV